MSTFEEQLHDMDVIANWMESEFPVSAGDIRRFVDAIKTERARLAADVERLTRNLATETQGVTDLFTAILKARTLLETQDAPGAWDELTEAITAEMERTHAAANPLLVDIDPAPGAPGRRGADDATEPTGN